MPAEQDKRPVQNVVPLKAECEIGPPPPFDPELAVHLPDVLRSVDAPLTSETISAARERSRTGRLSNSELCKNGDFNIATSEVAIRGEANTSIELLSCYPEGQEKPAGLMFHIHGGGMVAGSSRCMELALDLKRAHPFWLAVASPEYRLAPDYPDPVPIEDCYAALLAAVDDFKRLSGTNAPVILSGNSAGGGLAMGLALLCRDRGGPKIHGAMLQCPMLDDRCATTSSVQLEQTGVWDGRSNRVGWDALLGQRRATENVTAYAAPARARDLRGLPPIFIDVGSSEALRDEAVTFSSRIWAIGGSCELHVWDGAFHSFDQWVPEARISKAAEEARMSWLGRVLSRSDNQLSPAAE